MLNFLEGPESTRLWNIPGALPTFMLVLSFQIPVVGYWEDDATLCAQIQWHNSISLRLLKWSRALFDRISDDTLFYALQTLRFTLNFSSDAKLAAVEAGALEVGYRVCEHLEVRTAADSQSAGKLELLWQEINSFMVALVSEPPRVVWELQCWERFSLRLGEKALEKGILEGALKKSGTGKPSLRNPKGITANTNAKCHIARFFRVAASLEAGLAAFSVKPANVKAVLLELDMAVKSSMRHVSQKHFSGGAAERRPDQTRDNVTSTSHAEITVDRDLKDYFERLSDVVPACELLVNDCRNPERGDARWRDFRRQGGVGLMADLLAEREGFLMLGNRVGGQGGVLQAQDRLELARKLWGRAAREFGLRACANLVSLPIP
jgi:hypothetical protein